MLRTNQTEWQSPDSMDTECVALCRAINKIEGIQTIESCCGHGEHPYRVFFKADSLADLPFICFWLDRCHTGIAGWQVTVYTDCAMQPVTFLVEGTTGERSYRESESLAQMIEDGLKEVGGV